MYHGESCKLCAHTLLRWCMHHGESCKLVISVKRTHVDHDSHIVTRLLRKKQHNPDTALTTVFYSFRKFRLLSRLMQHEKESLIFKMKNGMTMNKVMFQRAYIKTVQNGCTCEWRCCALRYRFRVVTAFLAAAAFPAAAFPLRLELSGKSHWKKSVTSGMSRCWDKKFGISSCICCERDKNTKRRKWAGCNGIQTERGNLHYQMHHHHEVVLVGTSVGLPPCLQKSLETEWLTKNLPMCIPQFFYTSAYCNTKPYLRQHALKKKN